MYIPIWILIVICYILVGILVGYKADKSLVRYNEKELNEKINREVTVIFVLFSPFILVWWIFVSVFLKDWD